MSFFDNSFPGVRAMLEADIRQRQAQPHKPWCVMGLELGHWVVESSHDTREEAEVALADILRTCAPFIRNTFRIEERT